MNVAFVTNVVYPFVTGGAEKRVYEIGTRLAERGHDVTVYGRHFWDGPREMSYDGLQLRAVAEGRDIYTDDRRSIPEAIDFGARLVGPLRRHVDDHDLVVASVFPYFPVLAAAAATWRRDTPLVTTWHECWREYWWEYLGYLGGAGIAVERAAAAVPQHPVAVSGVTADRLAGIGPAREAIDVVHNGVDIERITGIDPATESFDVVFVGRLIEAKRVARLVRAVARLDGVTLGVIGDGPERERLEDLASSLDIEDRVSFLGFLDEYDDVLAQLHATEVFATASVREGFGITLVEAMAAGCTVVAADHPNSAAAEVVGKAGFLTDPTVTGMAQTLRRALDGDRPSEDPLVRARSFDWECVTDDAEAVYERAIDE
ncbi:glycosyltransferase family 4 protein [Haloarcula amylovorans]|uniref:glycosyltransferase family 4 protein n=1 Tax=Haloarcula amylovorans TaxID=2562280 RepID=UPI001075D6BA|nr:glycosyltransferase family 4 protein [Halomicroarcula amylolytica]